MKESKQDFGLVWSKYVKIWVFPRQKKEAKNHKNHNLHRGTARISPGLGEPN
jgi:hypothetical protein